MSSSHMEETKAQTWRRRIAVGLALLAPAGGVFWWGFDLTYDRRPVWWVAAPTGIGFVLFAGLVAAAVALTVWAIRDRHEFGPVKS